MNGAIVRLLSETRRPPNVSAGNVLPGVSRPLTEADFLVITGAFFAAEEPEWAP